MVQVKSNGGIRIAEVALGSSLKKENGLRPLRAQVGHSKNGRSGSPYKRDWSVTITSSPPSAALGLSSSPWTLRDL